MVSIFSYLNWWKSNRKLSDVVLCETAQLLPVGSFVDFLVAPLQIEEEEEERRRQEEEGRRGRSILENVLQQDRIETKIEKEGGRRGRRGNILPSFSTWGRAQHAWYEISLLPYLQLSSLLTILHKFWFLVSGF